jgi:outer membrane protein OmpU
MRETMKNLLLASTALVAFAGAAAAEVTVSGQGRFGVTSSNGGDEYFINTAGTSAGQRVSLENGAQVAFSSRLRVIFGMSFESDSGLTFGGSTRADNAAAANNGLAGSVFVSGDFGKLQVGDVDSAAKAAVGNISGIGYTGVGDYNETFYLLGGGGDPLANDDFSAYADPAALYSYSAGGATFYLGIGNPAGISATVAAGTLLPNGNVTANTTTLEASQQYSLGVEWANDQFSAAAGYESSKFENIQTGYSETLGAFFLGGSATFGGATVKAMYGDITDLDYSQYGMSVDYTFDAWTATAYFRTSDYGSSPLNPLANTDRTAYGFGLAYDLGGGVTVAGGVADPDIGDTNPDPLIDTSVFYQADLGVTFNF